MNKKENIVIFGLVFLVIGLMVLITTLFYFLVLKDDSETNTTSNTNTSVTTTPTNNQNQGGEGTGSANYLSSSTGLTQSGGTDTKSDTTYSATGADESAVLLQDGGTLSLSNITVNKTGDTSSDGNSSFYGQNAGVIATSGSNLTLTDSVVNGNGKGANGVFSTGEGTLVTVKNTKIYAYGDGAHAVMATQGGEMVLDTVEMVTTDAHSGAVATDRGGGTITGTNLTVTTSGTDSPAVYSTGNITISDSDLTATNAEAAVIEGGNTITLTDCNLSSSLEGKWGIMIYQSMSGDAEGTQGTFSMTGGTLKYTSSTGPLFYVNNSTGIINLSDVDVSASSGTLFEASANERWGTSGSNGGNIVFTGDNQTLSGNTIVDSISTISLTLKNSSALTGAVNSDDAGKSVSLTLDSSSTWAVTADSYLTVLSDSSGISGTSITNIIGNGYNVYYDSSASSNNYLGGKTYSLINGGSLLPK